MRLLTDISRTDASTRLGGAANARQVTFSSLMHVAVSISGVW